MRGGQGRGGGRRGGGRSKHRRRVTSFLQPCLLVMLHRSRDHGYNLFNGLDKFGFAPGRSDPSLVYRALRDMEEMGMVTSEWKSESLGPQRRVYKISPEGEEYLKVWIADLRRTRDEINTLLSVYQEVK